MEISTGTFVKTLAGHDKGSYFFILREEGEYVYLVDGKIRTLEKPKRKNRKHVEAIPCDGAHPGKKLKEQERVTDEELARFIKCFKKQLRAEESGLAFVSF